MSTALNLSATQLRQAASLKERIEALEAELGKLIGAKDATTTKPTKKRRRMSRAGRAAIAAAQKARWAKVKATASPK